MYAFAWLVCLLFILVKGGLGTMILPGYFDVDLVVILVAYLVTWHGDSWSGAFALGMGLLIDILSSAPLGLFSVIYLGLFLGIRLGDALVDLHSVKGQVIVVSLAVLIKKLLFIAFLRLLALEIAMDGRVLFAFFCSAVFTAVAAPVVFFFFDALGRVLGRMDAAPGDGGP